mmetsp:Transcript_23944/g.70235  ORF Transcript_23944/g.70235 Transcript_23944/m.70235 type:complete len:81 (-) Transcript_23944:1389-1631(-)
MGSKLEHNTIPSRAVNGCAEWPFCDPLSHEDEDEDDAAAAVAVAVARLASTLASPPPGSSSSSPLWCRKPDNEKTSMNSR